MPPSQTCLPMPPFVFSSALPVLNWRPVGGSNRCWGFSAACVSMGPVLPFVKVVLGQCYFSCWHSRFVPTLACLWILSRSSPFCVGDRSCCSGAGKAWTQMSRVWGCISPLPLTHSANVSKSCGCCLLSTICVPESRPTSYQAITTTTLSCPRWTNRK